MMTQLQVTTERTLTGSVMQLDAYVQVKSINVVLANLREVPATVRAGTSCMCALFPGVSHPGQATDGKFAHCSQGQELGYFSYGGSTVITVFQRGAIKYDADLQANSRKATETLVHMGSSLGVAAGK